MIWMRRKNARADKIFFMQHQNVQCFYATGCITIMLLPLRRTLVRYINIRHYTAMFVNAKYNLCENIIMHISRSFPGIRHRAIVCFFSEHGSFIAGLHPLLQ
jgi:hypothetical protein